MAVLKSQKNPFFGFFKSLLEYGFENAGLYYSSYRGIVFSNEDPEYLQRLQLIIPQVSGNQAHNYWAFPKNVFYGKGYGSQILPQKGDVVWVEFEGGRPEIPIWVHGHPARKEMPKDEELKDPNCYWFITPKGHKVKFNDTKSTIHIEHRNGHYVELNDESISLVNDEIKSISLGTLNKSKEPAVLGDTAMDLLNEFIDDLGKLTAIKTSTGITFSINSSPAWEPLVLKWKTKWKEFKSDLVNLD